MPMLVVLCKMALPAVKCCGRNEKWNRGGQRRGKDGGCQPIEKDQQIEHVDRQGVVGQ